MSLADGRRRLPRSRRPGGPRSASPTPVGTGETYLLNEKQKEARLAEPAGHEVRVTDGVHDIPGRHDCLACHESASPVLGFSALQLSPDRDPLALHADRSAGDLELPELVEKGWLRGLSPGLLESPPRIVARTPTERAALGYLHGNCGGCHRENGPLASLDMSLAYALGTGEADAITTTFDRPSQFSPVDGPSIRIMPGHPGRSVLLKRMRARDPVTAMPPLGTRVVDEAAVKLIHRWIEQSASMPSRVHE